MGNKDRRNGTSHLSYCEKISGMKQKSYPETIVFYLIYNFN
ncbi:hypothetical protein HMPREF9419_2317 [Prevotella nigrescens ATCC 33563]|nr:hypothetical protein HMPREF9419_2317 [Prevotella nigrescens ATCC 33563]